MSEKNKKSQIKEKKPPEKKEGIVSKILNAILTLLIVLVFVGIAFVMFSKKEGGGRVKGAVSVSGHLAFIVISGSMSPTFDPGALIVDKELTVEEMSTLKVDDIITYEARTEESAETFVTHRIVEVLIDDAGNYSFITRGDANNTDDLHPIQPEKIIGKVVFYLNGLGNAVNEMKTPFFMIGAVTLVVLLMLMPIFIKK